MKKKKMNGNTVLLIITIVLFFVMYAVGCAIYANKGFTHLQTFLNVLINNAGLLCITCGMTCVMLMEHERSGSLYSGPFDRRCIWNCTGFLCRIFKYPAIYCDDGGNVLRKRYDGCDLYGSGIDQQQ